MVASQCLVGGMEWNEKYSNWCLFFVNICKIDCILRSISFKFQNKISFFFSSPLICNLLFKYSNKTTSLVYI